MDQAQMPLFLLLKGDSDTPGTSEMLINLSHIRVVDRVTYDSARLVFSEAFTITVHGEKPVAEILALLAKNTFITDGRSLREALGITDS